MPTLDTFLKDALSGDHLITLLFFGLMGYPLYLILHSVLPKAFLSGWRKLRGIKAVSQTVQNVRKLVSEFTLDTREALIQAQLENCVKTLETDVLFLQTRIDELDRLKLILPGHLFDLELRSMKKQTNAVQTLVYLAHLLEGPSNPSWTTAAINLPVYLSRVESIRPNMRFFEYVIELGAGQHKEMIQYNIASAAKECLPAGEWRNLQAKFKTLLTSSPRLANV